MRVPFADVGPLKVPERSTTSRCCSCRDILPTGYMAAENCDIQPGDTVAVWGCGPGRPVRDQERAAAGRERVIAIDRFPERLRMARDRRRRDDQLRSRSTCSRRCSEMTGGRGPDACIDAVGMEAHMHGSSAPTTG